MITYGNLIFLPRVFKQSKPLSLAFFGLQYSLLYYKQSLIPTFCCWNDFYLSSHETQVWRHTSATSLISPYYRGTSSVQINNEIFFHSLPNFRCSLIYEKRYYRSLRAGKKELVSWPISNTFEDIEEIFAFSWQILRIIWDEIPKVQMMFHFIKAQTMLLLS